MFFPPSFSRVSRRTMATLLFVHLCMFYQCIFQQLLALFRLLQVVYVLVQPGQERSKCGNGKVGETCEKETGQVLREGWCLKAHV